MSNMENTYPTATQIPDVNNSEYKYTGNPGFAGGVIATVGANKLLDTYAQFLRGNNLQETPEALAKAYRQGNNILKRIAKKTWLSIAYNS